jgi:hypothetical protein
MCGVLSNMHCRLPTLMGRVCCARGHLKQELTCCCMAAMGSTDCAGGEEVCRAAVVNRLLRA